MPPEIPNTPEQPHPLESMIESTILQNEEIKANWDETNSLLSALIAQNENDNDDLVKAQIFQDKQIGDEIVKAVKEAPQTINFELQGVEMATLQGEQGEKWDKGDKGDTGFVTLEMPDGTTQQSEGKIQIKGLKGDKWDKWDKGDAGRDGIDGKDGQAFLWINGKNGIDGIDWKDGVDWADGKDWSPDTPKQIKKKLESLKDDERLDISAIKWVKDFQKQINRVAGFASQGQEYRIAGTKVSSSSSVLNFIAGGNTTITGVPTSDGADITITASGGGGAVDSVNWQTGVVVLDTGDIAEATDANYVSDAQLVVISNTSGTNTGDQTNITGNAGTVTTISGRITAGANVTITGSGTAASPYSIAASGGGGGSPGGSDTQVQFNDGGAFGGDAGMTYSKATNTLKVDTLSTSATDLNIIWGSGGWVLLQWGAGLEDNGVTIAGSAWSASFDTTNLSDARSVSLPDYDGVVALPPDEGTAWYVLTSGWPWVQPTYQAPGGWGGWTTWKVKTANYTAANWEGVLCDSSGSAFTVTLPASPSAGNSVIVKSWSSAATNNITIGRNSQTIVGVAADMTISQPNIEVNFVYSGSTWSI